MDTFDANTDMRPYELDAIYDEIEEIIHRLDDMADKYDSLADRMGFTPESACGHGHKLRYSVRQLRQFAFEAALIADKLDEVFGDDD